MIWSRVDGGWNTQSPSRSNDHRSSANYPELDSATCYCHDVSVDREEQGAYSIGELAEEAGVSTRTIRYYVSEGLLPPPAGAGPNSRYTDAHREQLEIIGRLKQQYLPLKEIRRRLIGHGPLAHGSAAGALYEDAMGLPPSDPPNRPPEADWIRTERRRLAAEDLASPPQSAPRFAEAAHLNYSLPPPVLDEEQPPLWLSPVPSGERTWRRVAISDEAELLISESQYHRHRDKIDWLVQWAKRVLDG